MNNTHRELARQTFVLLNEIVEDAHEITIAGQSPKLMSNEIADHALTLQQMSEDIGAMSAFLHCLSMREESHD